MNDIFKDTINNIGSVPSFIAGVGIGWLARKLMGRIWSVYYSVKRLGRL